MAANPYAGLFWDMISGAQDMQASDIHIQPESNGVDIRFRIHGELSRWMWVEERHKTAFLQQTKQLSNCILGMSGIPQDGRISLPEKRLDIRVSLVPSVFGEKLVLRLLDRRDPLSLDQTGLDQPSVEAICWALRQGSGLALFSGPTGSGKTTVLNAALSAVDRFALNVVTIEDPVDYTFPGVTQLQVSSKLTMADALRAMLRQDPDVILLGEVRDPETALICFQAAATGHLVLSTIHANSASEVWKRLELLGLENDQIQSSLRFASAQRLIGRLCQKCRIPGRDGYFSRGIGGCPTCHGGLEGRNLIFEFVKYTGTVEASPPLQHAALRLAEVGLVDREEACHVV